jgi:predicted aspartyl protease
MYDGSARMINKAHELKPTDPEITLMWLTTLPRPQRVEQLKAFLSDRLDLDAGQRADISSYVDSLNDWSKQKDHQCRLVSNVTAAEAPLIPLSNERHSLNEVQLFTDRRPDLGGFGLSVVLNGHRNVLLLDTGASGILIGRGFAKEAGITNLVRTRIGGIGGHGWTEASVGIADTIKIGDMEFHNCPVRVADYFGANVDGLIGADVFEKFLIDIDFPNEKLKLSELPKRPGEKEKQLGLTNAEGAEQPDENAPQDRYIAPEMQSFTRVLRFDRDLLVATSIGDVPPKLFLLDTGATKNVISPTAAEEVTKVHRAPHVTVRGISGTVSEVYTAKQAVIRFGHLSQKNQQMIGFDTTSVSDGLGTEVSGFLGFAVLRMLDIKIDYRDGLVNFSFDARKWNEIKHKYR